LPPENNPEITEVIAHSIAGEKLVLGFELATADPQSRLLGPELQVSLLLAPKAEPELVRETIERVSSYWSKSETFATSVDSVAIKLRS
jgi:hypothetical protein